MMKNRILFLSIFLIQILSFFGANAVSTKTAKESKVGCDLIKKGTGYYPYFQRDVPMIEKIDEASFPRLNDIFISATNDLFKESINPSFNMREGSFSIKPEQVVKIKMKGASYDIDFKELSKIAQGQDLGYVIFIMVYSLAPGTKDGKSLFSGKIEELPYIELTDGKDTIKVFDFLYIRSFLVDVTLGKDIAGTKELHFSYREWFMKKNPQYFSGESTELPAGVSYNAASQYKLFIKESIQNNLETMPEYKTLSSCKKEKE